MLHKLLSDVRRTRRYNRLPERAKAEVRDERMREGTDPGPADAIDAAVEWLGRAQENSTSRDGGVARHFSLISGWSASYPETSGYIVPTLLQAANVTGSAESRNRATRVLDWLVAIQLPGGGFQGGVIGQTPVVPVTFNTGQILIGLAAGAAEVGDAYVPAMHAAAQWLCATQSDDGAWRSHPTPFAEPGEKAYETHVAWGLLEAARVSPDRGYAEAAARNIEWALTKQRPNGWFSNCCLNDPVHPLTHTIGYVLRGVIEGYRYSPNEQFLDAAMRTARGALSALGEDGALPGRLSSDWTAAASWVCLTGSVQIAHCWMLLYQITGEEALRDAAFRTNAYVRRRVRADGPPETRGGVKGSFPITGDYGTFEYLNWACKFFIDSNQLEQELRRSLTTQ